MICSFSPCQAGEVSAPIFGMRIWFAESKIRGEHARNCEAVFERADQDLLDLPGGELGGGAGVYGHDVSPVRSKRNERFSVRETSGSVSH